MKRKEKKRIVLFVPLCVCVLDYLVTYLFLDLYKEFIKVLYNRNVTTTAFKKSLHNTREVMVFTFYNMLNKT